MSYRVTVHKITTLPTGQADALCDAKTAVETEVYRQTVDDLNLSKLTALLTRTPRVRKPRAKATP